MIGVDGDCCGGGENSKILDEIMLSTGIGSIYK